VDRLTFDQDESVAQSARWARAKLQKSGEHSS
jgi:hypothetical protein